MLVVGGGGREHSLALAISHDPHVVAVHCAPGSPGTEPFASNHPVDICDASAVADLAEQVGANLVVIGPEAPLVAGVADEVSTRGIAVFGPGRAAAQLEGSKTFAKQVMAAAKVPTARSFTATTQEEAAAALDAFGAPYVVKDDGLAAGKGVVVTDDRQAALDHAAACERVVIEEYLDGPEVSLFVVTDGTAVRALLPSQDHKRVADNDEGPNTGGMGAYCPLPWAPENLVDEVLAGVVHPTLAEMRRRGTPFRGLLYVGLALTSKGPRVVEFNVRFGDPETEVVLPLLRSPLAQLLYAAATGTLADFEQLEWSHDAAVGVVIAAAGYPSTPRKGGVIKLPPDTDQFDGFQGRATSGVHVIHAGTARRDGELVANGGRVLVVVGRGPNSEMARQVAYDFIAAIDYPDGFCRTDIGSAGRQDAFAAQLAGKRL